MNCSNHPDAAVAAYCRTCGKPLCSNCTRDVRGVTYCESCLAARMEGQASAPQQTVYQQVMDQGMGLKVPPGPSSGPNPTVAGILAGVFPIGVGAVYNGQYAKGLTHLIVTITLIVGLSSDLPWYVDVFMAISLGFFYFYQIMDAVRSAHAIQAGRPAPDPMGLGTLFGEDIFGEKSGEKLGGVFSGGKTEGRVPPGAVVLIGLGVLFLLHTLGIFEYGLVRFWPLFLIFLGGWMLLKRKNHGSLTGAIMVLTTGLIFLLDTLNVAGMGIHRTWPAWILAAGVAQLLRGKPEDGPSQLPPPAAPPVAPGETTSSSSSEVHHG
jgi:hypothetical protein